MCLSPAQVTARRRVPSPFLPHVPAPVRRPLSAGRHAVAVRRPPRSVARRGAMPSRGHRANDSAPSCLSKTASVARRIFLQLLVDLVKFPLFHFDVLDPLVVADGYAAGVGQDVREDGDPSLEQVPIGYSRRGTVCRFHDAPGLDLGRRPRGSGSPAWRYQDVARQEQQSALLTGSQSGSPTTEPVLRLCAITLAGSKPRRFTMPPVESLTAITRAPAWAKSSAAIAPALPNP